MNGTTTGNGPPQVYGLLAKVEVIRAKALAIFIISRPPWRRLRGRFLRALDFHLGWTIRLGLGQ